MGPRFLLTLTLPAVAAVLLSGCGAGDVIDPRKTEIALKYDVEGATREKVKSVTCPSDVPATTGTRFTCRVTTVTGDDAVAELEVTADNGNLRVLGLEAP